MLKSKMQQQPPLSKRSRFTDRIILEHKRYRLHHKVISLRWRKWLIFSWYDVKLRSSWTSFYVVAGSFVCMLLQISERERSKVSEFERKDQTEKRARSWASEILEMWHFDGSTSFHNQPLSVFEIHYKSRRRLKLFIFDLMLLLFYGQSGWYLNFYYVASWADILTMCRATLSREILDYFLLLFEVRSERRSHETDIH